MKYYIIEIQKQIDGTCAHLVHTADARNQAESIYHQVLAAAAISNVFQHAAVLLKDTGVEIMHQCYNHPQQPAPEPEPEN